MLGRPDADFSLSGLKTAVRLAAESVAPLRPRDVADLCASFQAAVVDVVEDRIRMGLKLFRRRIGVAPRAVVVAGGVAANAALREALTQFCAEAGLPFVAPPPKLCTDNGAMIAWAGVERLRLGMIDGLDAPGRPRWPLDPEIRAHAQQQGLKRAPLSWGLGAAERRLGVLRARRRRLLLRLFVRHVMADDAAANRAHNAMMAGIVAGDAADDRALQATLRLGRRRAHGQRRDQKRASRRRSLRILMTAFLCSRSGEVEPAIWVRPRPLGKVQRKHFTWSSPVRAANHCNSACARLYNAFPLKFDPLRLRLRGETCERAQTIIKELPFMSDAPLMPKATAVWLVENTSLTFDQIAEFCKLHPLEVKGIADGEVATGIKGYDPISTGQLTREEIAAGEKDPNHRLHLSTSKTRTPEFKKPRGARYTPLSRRHDRPNAVLWLLRNHPELKDAQIMRLVGTTKHTLQAIRERTHWNSANLQPMDPVTLGLCSQIDLDFEVNRAAKERPKVEDDRSQTLVSAEITTARPTAAPASQLEVFGVPTPSPSRSRSGSTSIRCSES